MEAGVLSVFDHDCTWDWSREMGKGNWDEKVKWSNCRDELRREGFLSGAFAQL